MTTVFASITSGGLPAAALTFWRINYAARRVDSVVPAWSWQTVTVTPCAGAHRVVRDEARHAADERLNVRLKRDDGINDGVIGVAPRDSVHACLPYWLVGEQVRLGGTSAPDV